MSTASNEELLEILRLAFGYPSPPALSSVAPLPVSGPFALADPDAYSRWRDAKLAAYPKTLGELVVEVRDPRAPTPAEHAALLRRCQAANMAVYASPCSEEDKEIPRKLGAAFGLHRLDNNMGADEDGITSLKVQDDALHKTYIPYTDRPIHWHTDGYYNLPQEQIQGLILHCVRPARQGGENALLDHEIAYLLLREADPEFIRALMHPQAMCIPPNTAEGDAIRPERCGPVFSVTPQGRLHMRYTKRTRSIRWREDATTLAAARALENLLDGPSPYIFRATLQPGQGLLCNNVLHDRSGFSDAADSRRLLYRARYYDRIAGT